MSKQLKIPYLSTGHIFRRIAREKTRLGRYVKETLNVGMLIPDNKTIPIVKEYLAKREYRRGYILDGFPRTLPQAQNFKEEVDRVIHLSAPDREALWRIAYRNDQIREDETLPAIRKRIELFNQVTKPVIEYYRKKKKLVEIDGTKSINQVNKDILNNLGKQLAKDKIKDFKKKKKTILAIVGLPGAGKTEAANFFAEKGLPVVQFGKVVNDYIDKHNLNHDEPTHKRIREGLRKKHGLEAFAVLNEDKISQKLKKSPVVVIDGMRSFEEYTYLKEGFKRADIFILALYAERELRYERLSKRKYRNKLYGEKRDINELLGTNMGPTIALADFVIDNNSSLEEFRSKLEHIYQAVYFS